MRCGVGRRRGLDLMLPWRWCRLAAAAQIRPLAWEPPYASGAARKKKKKHREAGARRRIPSLSPAAPMSLGYIVQSEWDPECWLLQLQF